VNGRHRHVLATGPAVGWRAGRACGRVWRLGSSPPSRRAGWPCSMPWAGDR